MKAIFGYILTLAVAVLFTLYFDGRAGVVFIAVLIIAAVVSGLMTLQGKRKISFSLKASASILNKGDSVSFTTVFQKKGIMPAPFVEMELFSSIQFEAPAISRFKVSVSSKGEEAITQNYTAKIRGAAEIGIKSIVITDFLGLVSFNIYQEKGLREHTVRFEINPDIPETSARNELLRSVCDAVAYDDNEETKDNPLAFSGVAGYEHRKYVAGDSIRKINWKLSSKRDELLVRLDEGSAPLKLNIAADLFRKGNSYEETHSATLLEEKNLEAILAILKLIVSLNLECNVYFYSGGWRHRLGGTPDDLNSLRYDFIECTSPPTISKSARIPLDFISEQEKAGSLMVFTSCLDRQLSAELEGCSRGGIFTQTVVGEIPAVSVEGMWLADEDFEFRSI